MTGFDLTALRDSRVAEKKEEDQKRLDKLAGDAVMLIDNIFKATFPTDSTGNPDWDKFDWTKAEQLKQLLADFQAGRAPRRNRDDDRPQQDQTRRQAPAPAPAAPAALDDEPEPAADTNNAKPQGRVRKVLSGVGARLNQ